MKDTVVPMLVGSAGPAGTNLGAPKLGVWSNHPRHGVLVEPGSAVGTLAQLGRRFRLVVPDGVSGRVAIEGRSLDAFPVEYGEPLFRVTPVSSLASAASSREAAAARETKGALELVAPTDGVFYRAPGVDARPYVSVGDRVATGQPVGLIEVMKTFNPIAFGGAGFPDQAEVVEVLAADGQEVRAGQVLVVVKTL